MRPRATHRHTHATRPRVASVVLALATLATSALVVATPAPATAAPNRRAAATATTITWSQQAHVTNATFRTFGMGDASHATIATWAQLLLNGSPRIGVANEATGNDWWRGTLVDIAYVQVLGRHPSASSSIARVKALASGGTRADLYSALYGSSEFYRVVSGGHAATFLAKLYSGVLNHAPDAAAVAAWTKRMATGMASRNRRGHHRAVGRGPRGPRRHRLPHLPGPRGHPHHPLALGGEPGVAGRAGAAEVARRERRVLQRRAVRGAACRAPRLRPRRRRPRVAGPCGRPRPRWACPTCGPARHRAWASTAPAWRSGPGARWASASRAPRTTR